jgi:hypothetical protein
MTIACRKAEIEASFPHEQSAPSSGQDREAAVPARLPPGQKARGKIFRRSFRITH